MRSTLDDGGPAAREVEAHEAPEDAADAPDHGGGDCDDASRSALEIRARERAAEPPHAAAIVSKARVGLSPSRLRTERLRKSVAFSCRYPEGFRACCRFPL